MDIFVHVFEVLGQFEAKKYKLAVLLAVIDFCQR
jgi:hypothetical protein